MRSASLAASLLLSACAGWRPGPPDLPPLLPPAALAPRSAQQVLRAEYPGGAAAILCAVEIGLDALTVIGVTALGQRVFTVRQTAAAIEQESSPLLPKQFRPEQLLADLQMAYAPLAQLQAAWSGSLWQALEPQAGLRQIQHQGGLIAEVYYSPADPWAARLRLVNARYGYSLTVDPVTEE